MLNAVGQAQHILLLGGTSEIGLGIVEEFVSRGGSPTVTLATRKDSPRVDDARERIERSGTGTVNVVDFDATAFDTHEDTLNAIFDEGDVDVAIVAFGSLGDQEELWQNQRVAVDSAQLNYTAPVSVGVLLGQRMKNQGHGTIVAMSSVAGMRVRRSNFVYGASKAGVDGFYTQLGEALRGTGVNVLVVRPGQVRTKMTADMGKEAPFTVDVDTVAKDTVSAVLDGKSHIFVHKAFGPISLVLQHIPAFILRRLNL